MEVTVHPDGEHWSFNCPLPSEDRDRIQSGAQPSTVWIGGHLDRETARFIRRYLHAPRMFLSSATVGTINELVRNPTLKHLEAMSMKGKCPLRGDCDLETFHVMPARITDDDMATILSWRKLKSLRLRCVDLKPRFISGLHSLGELRALDLEDGNLNDPMAAQLAKACPQLQELQIANTRISIRGLRVLVEGLPELESIDIWGTRVRCPDLEVLANATRLRYLSCGGAIPRHWPGHELIRHLGSLKSLREVWLDGVVLTDAEELRIHHLVSNVRITRR